MKKIKVSLMVFLFLAFFPLLGSARTGKILLGGNWGSDMILTIQVANPNSSGVITITNLEFFNPDGSAAMLKAPFPIPQTLNPHEVRAYNMLLFLNPVPPQAPWHPNAYTIVIHWQGDVANDLIAQSETAVYDSEGKLITIIINQFDSRSLQ
jgi:hypothetical protein